MNKYSVVVEGIFGVKGVMELALHKCAHKAPSLHREWMDRYGDRICGMSTDEYRMNVDEFIKEKGLRVVDAKPVARVEGDRYVVDVYCTVAW